MIHITKGEEPKELEGYKIHFKHNNKRSAVYSDLDSDNDGKRVKGIVKGKLIQEQKGICCYCCNQISIDTSHIEHFRPKGVGAYMKLSLEYNNLFASCMGAAVKQNSHCGDFKENNFDEQLLISPLEEDCALHFKYTSYGHILPKDNNDQRAQYTIDTLNLKAKRLVAAREKALWEYGVLGELAEGKKQELYERYVEGANNQLIPFVDAVLYMLKN